MRPFVSIILTTHERPHLLARSLTSLVNQTNQDFQIVVCSDEGSTQTKKVATQYLRKTDVLLVLPHMRGPAETRNAGIEFSAARRIMFLDDDDSFDLNFMADLSSILDTNPINDLLYFNYSKIEESTNENNSGPTKIEKIVQKYKNSESLLVGNFIPNNSYCVDALVARKCPFDARLQSHEDWDFLIGISALVKFKWIDMFGPNVHLAPDSSRNSSPHSTGSVSLDFLSIYRKWPAKDDKTKLLRQAQLRAYGVDVSLQFL